MTETEAEPELYVPKPGSIPWRVLAFLLANPHEELTRGDVAVRFNCIGGGTDAILQLAVARGCLKRSRNSKGEMIWLLGLVKRFRLDPDPNADDSEQVKLLQDAVQPEKAASPAPATPAPAPPPVAACTPAPVKHQAIKVVEPLAKWTASPKPTGPAPFPGETVARTEPAPKAIIVAAPTPVAKPAEPVAKEPEIKTELELDIPRFTGTNMLSPRETEGSLPVTVAMPLHLTPELIEAVKTDPATSFDNNADSHHAIGWLFSAYEVMVKKQISRADQ